MVHTINISDLRYRRRYSVAWKSTRQTCHAALYWSWVGLLRILHERKFSSWSSEKYHCQTSLAFRQCWLSLQKHRCYQLLHYYYQRQRWSIQNIICLFVWSSRTWKRTIWWYRRPTEMTNWSVHGNMRWGGFSLHIQWQHWKYQRCLTGTWLEKIQSIITNSSAMKLAMRIQSSTQINHFLLCKTYQNIINFLWRKRVLFLWECDPAFV